MPLFTGENRLRASWQSWEPVPPATLAERDSTVAWAWLFFARRTAMDKAPQDRRRLIARLAVAIMVADGRITASERDALERFDRLGLGPLAALAEDEIRRAMQHPIDVRGTCASLSSRSRGGHPLRLRRRPCPARPCVACARVCVIEVLPCR